MTVLEAIMKKLGYDNKRKFIFKVTMDIVILSFFAYTLIQVGGITCYQGLTLQDLQDLECNLYGEIELGKDKFNISELLIGQPIFVDREVMITEYNQTHYPYPQLPFRGLIAS